MNIRDVPEPVPTEKGQESEANLESVVAPCKEPHATATQESFAWTSSNSEAMEEVLHQGQAKAFHVQAGCQAYN